MHHAVALALFMGPGLVLVSVNAAFTELAKWPVMLGLPVAEAYAHPSFRPLQRTMRHVARTGVPVRMWAGDGWLWVIPYRSGDACGVVTSYQPSVVPLASPSPVLQEMA